MKYMLICLSILLLLNIYISYDMMLYSNKASDFFEGYKIEQDENSNNYL